MQDSRNIQNMLRTMEHSINDARTALNAMHTAHDHVASCIETIEAHLEKLSGLYQQVSLDAHVCSHCRR